MPEESDLELLRKSRASWQDEYGLRGPVTERKITRVPAFPAFSMREISRSHIGDNPLERRVNPDASYGSDDTSECKKKTWTLSGTFSVSGRWTATNVNCSVTPIDIICTFDFELALSPLVITSNAPTDHTLFSIPVDPAMVDYHSVPSFPSCVVPAFSSPAGGNILFACEHNEFVMNGLFFWASFSGTQTGGNNIDSQIGIFNGILANTPITGARAWGDILIDGVSYPLYGLTRLEPSNLPQPPTTNVEIHLTLVSS